MSDTLPVIYLARHGETEWSVEGKHTGRTDLPLTTKGERNARRLKERLRDVSFAKVFTSPLKRASKTCDLAGYGDVAEIMSELTEWDYGEYEGQRTAEIQVEHPGWNLFRDGCPGGETLEQVANRADRAIARVREINQNVLLFSSGHLLRVLGARWIGMRPSAGQYFYLSTASVSVVGYDHNISEHLLRLWNDTSHLQS